VAGLLVVVVGVVWALLAPPAGPYGWFAYTPLDPELSASGGDESVVLSTGQVVGIVIAAVGVVVLAAWAGFRLGRRRARPGPS